MTVSVIVPTYSRPAFLRRCLEALLRQTRLPDQIIVVVRPEDRESQAVVHEVQRTESGRRIETAWADSPGYIYALSVGLRHVTREIAVQTDDDAEPYENWLERLTEPYADSGIGGVGGSIEEYAEGGRVAASPVRQIGRVLWYGRYVGGFHRLDPQSPPFDAHFLRGANMSYRTALWKEAGIDLVLNRADYHCEVDIGFKIRKRGYRLVCQPAARIRHFNAGRTSGNVYASPPPPLMEGRAHNYVYVMLNHLSLPRKAAFLAWSLAVGEKSSWGLIYALIGGRTAPDGRVGSRLRAAFRGKWLGIRSYLRRKGRTRA